MAVVYNICYEFYCIITHTEPLRFLLYLIFTGVKLQSMLLSVRGWDWMGIMGLGGMWIGLVTYFVSS